jgi:thioredoxin reductase
VFGDGRTLKRAALFFNTGQHQRSPLAEALGCEFDDRGGVVTAELDVSTCVPGVYVAGDASRDVQLIVVAAAEGVKAAFAINKQLLSDDGLA